MPATDPRSDRPPLSAKPSNRGQSPLMRFNRAPPWCAPFSCAPSSSARTIPDHLDNPASPRQRWRRPALASPLL